MNQTWSRGLRVERTSLTALLAVGDLAAIGLFVIAGELSHGYALPEHAGRFVGTFVPFAVGWILVGVVGNLYTEAAVAGLRKAVSWTVLAWGLAVVVAQLLRSTSLFPGNAALTFALVSFAVGGALLVTGRVLVSFLR